VTEADGLPRIDRQLSRLISLCGLVLIAGQTVPRFGQVPDFAVWWNVTAAGLLVMIIVFAVAGHRLPYAVLRVGWRVAPVIGSILWGCAFLAYTGPVPAEIVPWAWTFEAVLVCYLVLWWPPWAAVAGAAVSGLLPAGSALIFLGSVPDEVAQATPIHVGNLAFVLLVAGMRARLVRLRAAERGARQLEEARLRTCVEAAQRRRVADLVHDDVLSVLTAAAAFTGRPPAALSAEARHALNSLGLSPASRAPRDGAVESVRDRLTAQLAELDPRCPVDLVVDAGTLPAAVIEVITGAAGEALRNSVRHAGPGAVRRVHGRLGPDWVWIEIADDGCGFDPSVVEPGRLGVRSSIVGRMRSVPGGDARIDARRGHGVTVVLSWRT